jgi:hypothetical protein
MVQQALDRGYEVVGVCRAESMGKLDAFTGRITVLPGPTSDREVIKRAVSGATSAVVLVPRGVWVTTRDRPAVSTSRLPRASVLVWLAITRMGATYPWKLKRS